VPVADTLDQSTLALATIPDNPEPSPINVPVADTFVQSTSAEATIPVKLDPSP